jgi:GT2 family glycosyltransferase
MPPSSLPDDVRRLLDERATARSERDWARADAIRDRIAALGWEVQDTEGATTARPILVREAEAADPIDGPAEVDASVQLTAEDHPDDLSRFLRGLAAHPPSATWELVIVANAPAEPVATTLGAVALPVEPIVLESDGRLGWADSRTLGLRHSLGEVTILLDTSLEPTGDFVRPLLAAFDDPAVGIAGGWGVTSPDAREFDEAPPGPVDAVEAYCLAIRREALRAIGGFDRRFRYYRNADLDFSFSVRDAGWIAIRTDPLPLQHHEHRGWSALPDAERDRLSKRNFYRFLDRWGDRPDLLLHPDPDR